MLGGQLTADSSRRVKCGELTPFPFLGEVHHPEAVVCGVVGDPGGTKGGQ